MRKPSSTGLWIGLTGPRKRLFLRDVPSLIADATPLVNYKRTVVQKIVASDIVVHPAPNLVVPSLLPLVSMRELLGWYRENVCRLELRDPRSYRVRFLPENFVHLIKLTNKYYAEPRNARLTLDEIERGRINFKHDHFDPQRAAELGWARPANRTASVPTGKL